MNPKLKNVLEWVYCFVIAIVVALIIKYFIGTLTVVKQTSMNDTLKEGQRLCLNRWVRTVKGDYNYNDIITFEAPSKIPNFYEVNLEDPVAIYSYEPKTVISKFLYYVIETGKTSYIKRVIGLPGDHIKIENGKVYRNGEILEEQYVKSGVITESKTYSDITVPEDCVFVMGDNREHSTDSREFGCVPMKRIEGRVAFRVWPLNKFGKID